MTNGPSSVGKCKDVPAIFFRIFYQQNVEVNQFYYKKKLTNWCDNECDQCHFNSIINKSLHYYFLIGDTSICKVM